MGATEKRMPWWLMVVTGLLILIAGIFLLVSPGFLNVLIVLIGLGALLLGIYFLYKAAKNKDENRIFLTFLIHGLLNLVLSLLIFVIRDSPALLGVILASWLIIFGVFGLIEARQESGDQPRYRLSMLLVVSGLVLMILPPLLHIGYDIFLGIIGIVIGVVRTVQGIVCKVRADQGTSGRRSNIL